MGVFVSSVGYLLILYGVSLSWYTVWSTSWAKISCNRERYFLGASNCLYQYHICVRGIGFARVVES